MVRVRLFADIREKAGESEVEVKGETVGDVIENLVEQYPSLEGRLLNDGELRAHLNLTADGEPVEPEASTDGVEEVAVFPPVSGGGVQSEFDRTGLSSIGSSFSSSTSTVSAYSGF